MFIPKKFTRYKEQHIEKNKPACSTNKCTEVAIGEFYDKDSDGFGGSTVRTVKMCAKCLENNNKEYEKIFGKRD